MRIFCSSKSTTEGLFLHYVWCLVRYVADSPNPVPGLEHFCNRVWCEHYNWQLLMSHRITRDSLFILETFRLFFSKFYDCILGVFLILSQPRSFLEFMYHGKLLLKGFLWQKLKLLRLQNDSAKNCSLLCHIRRLNILIKQVNLMRLAKITRPFKDISSCVGSSNILSNY